MNGGIVLVVTTIIVRVLEDNLRPMHHEALWEVCLAKDQESMSLRRQIYRIVDERV